jgi:uncharacterized protein YprB with RNaseH-like and TPR domain
MAEMSLADRLKALGVKVGARDLPPPRPRSHRAIESVMPGRYLATDSGQVFVVESTYPPDQHHGQTPLRGSATLHAVARWAHQPQLSELDLKRLLFLDTETTGLAGGTGTYAFLVGVGYHTEDGFRLLQLFMRDPLEESPFLEALTLALREREALVTFNGKAFDVPLLNTRYIANGTTSPLGDLAHLDLLPLARRLWRSRLPSRALSALETHILGATRAHEDVPGWLIPSLYFDYLRSGDATPLAGVFHHNAMDILALAALLNHVAQLLMNPLDSGIEEGLDLVDMGSLFEDLGEGETAIELYARGLMCDLPPDVRESAMRRLATLQRRRGCLDGAVAVWEEAASQQQVYACVELAKHYEHRLRDYQQAAAITRQAMETVAGANMPTYVRRRYLAELNHRLSRLQRKIARAAPQDGR